MRNSSGSDTKTARRTGTRWRAGSGLMGLGILLCLSPVFPQEKPAGKPEAKQAEAAAPAGPATYVGSETCQTCHDDIFKAFEKNPHAVVAKDKRRGWEGKACEACHGPGSKHAESASAADIRNPARLAAGQTDEVCLACHLKQPTHVGRINGSHARNQVACTACHSIHKGPAAMVARKPAAVNEQCKGCHLSTWAQFQRPYKHKLPEGAMSCVDCHDPHGSFLAKALQTISANEPGCLKCHGDKRGPFTFEHAPVRMEGCAACHEPHGSANPRMLTRADARYLCLECHANIANPAVSAVTGTIGAVPPALHDMRSPRFRNCTVCHQKIHGSFVNRALLR